MSTLPSRAGRDASGGKKPRLWMPLFSYMWEHTVPEPLLNSALKKNKKGQVRSPEFKKTRLIFCDTESFGFTAFFGRWGTLTC